MASSQIPAVITYHKPGTRPPLYVAGTFSDPPWQPYEMDHTARPDGEYDFTKEVRGEPGSKILYKFRIGDGDWWVLKDDGPTMTDSAGNTNHVLEVTTQEKELSNGQAAGPEAHPSYAKVATKHLQPPAGQAAADRSGTGTPISARVAAEVADSAALLHEEVPERQRPERSAADSQARRQSTSPMSKIAETAAEVADTAETLDNGQNTILILEPPAGEGPPFKVQPRGEELLDDQEGYIADKSPLFSHECVGLYESDEEEQEDVVDEDDATYDVPVDDIDPDNIDLNDPTLERFPSNREDIMDAVRKLETGLQADQAAFDGNARSPVVNPSRRGTEDITADFQLTAPQVPSPPAHRPSKKSPRGSVGSIPTAALLQSISEAEEPTAEGEDDFRPAVVFSNPMKPRPQHLKLPTSDEDEGVAGVSPRTVKPPRHSIATSETSESHSPPSPQTERKGSHPPDTSDDRAGADDEPDKGKEPQSDNPGPAEADSAKATEFSHHTTRPSYSQAASSHPTVTESPSESNTTAPAQQPQSTHGSGGSKDTTSRAPSGRRRSYAEVAAARPSSAEGPSDDKVKTPQSGESSTTAKVTGTAQDSGTDKDNNNNNNNNKSANLKKRGGPSRGETAKAADSSARAPAVRPKKGGWWIRAIGRFIFEDIIGRIIRRVLNVVGSFVRRVLTAAGLRPRTGA